jgi:hypothetical protein
MNPDVMLISSSPSVLHSGIFKVPDVNGKMLLARHFQSLECVHVLQWKVRP